METNKSLMWKTAGTHGLIVGMVLIIMALLVWFTDLEQATWLQYLNWLIVVASVYISMKTWRDQYMGGVIKYSQALGYGVAVMFFASVIFAVYNIIYMNYLDPESIERGIDFMEELYYEKGWPEEQIEAAIILARRMQTPLLQAFSTILGTTFLGLLVSLIVAIFIKKEGDPFADAMRGVESEHIDNQ